MTGRPLRSEEEMIAKGYGRPEMIRRRVILRETLAKFRSVDHPKVFQQIAAKNLARWRQHSDTAKPRGETLVIAGDWGEVTLRLTKKYGECFAVLNMANAYVPGGGYIEGMVAQEENMYRRTDCHFHIGPKDYDQTNDLYRPEMTHLISGSSGKVYLDTAQPRICLRGPENRERDDLGYEWLPSDLVFPFFELRAAAQDLRRGDPFNLSNARCCIAAQLDTLREAGVRYAVLGAFGCGAFQNPATEIARLYSEEIHKRRDDFALVAFAIFAAGYGPDNYAPFAERLG